MSHSVSTFPRKDRADRELGYEGSESTGGIGDSDVDEEGDGEYLYIQMEHCPNQTLRYVINEGQSSPEAIWRLFRQTLEAIDHIHSKGIYIYIYIALCLFQFNVTSDTIMNLIQT